MDKHDILAILAILIIAAIVIGVIGLCFYVVWILIDYFFKKDPLLIRQCLWIIAIIVLSGLGNSIRSND